MEAITWSEAGVGLGETPPAFILPGHGTTVLAPASYQQLPHYIVHRALDYVRHEGNLRLEWKVGKITQYCVNT